jgi:hypothetical protein
MRPKEQRLFGGSGWPTSSPCSSRQGEVPDVINGISPT